MTRQPHPRSGVWRLNANTCRAIRRRWEQGFHVAAIASEFGATTGEVKRVLKNSGVASAAIGNRRFKRGIGNEA